MSILVIICLCHYKWLNVLNICQFGRGGGHNKLIFSQLYSCSLFIESLFSQLFSHHSERPYYHSERPYYHSERPYYHSERFARCHSEASPELVEGRSEESIEAPYGSCNTQEVHSVRLTGVGAQLPLVLHCPSVACCHSERLALSFTLLLSF